jgi:hypothetical protein
MLSITFALLRSYTALSFWQVMVAVMSLDITSAIVQMALSQKDTLASRWWITLNTISQLLVQASLGIVLGKTFPFSSGRQDPCQNCVRMVWWGTFDSCKEVPPAFCIYWVVRGLLVMRSCAIGLHHMHYYDLGERVARGEKLSQELSRSSHVLRLLTFTDIVNEKTAITPGSAREVKVWSLEAFPRMPATTLTDWILWTLPAIGAVSSLERMLSLFELSNPGSMKDWGQTTTFMAVICGLVARAIYLFYAKLKRRSCLERAKAAVDLSKSKPSRKKTLYAENFVSFTSKCRSFRDIQRVLQPIDCVRWQLPQEVWYQHIDLEEAEKEFLRSAVLNDDNGLLAWAKYLPDLSTVVDDMKRTALHLALEKNNIEAIETIMGLIDPEPQPGESSTSASMRWERLLDASDKVGRTPWRMIMPLKYNQMDKEILEAALRFKYPVRQPDGCGSSSQIINRIFTLPYSLEVIEAWSRAAKKSQSLRQLEDSIIQAVGSVCCPSSTSEVQSWCKNTWDFCCLKFNDLDGTQFATRLLKALMHSPRCRSTPAHAASRFTQFIKQKQVWAMEIYADIAQVVATHGDSLDDIRLLIKQCPQNLRIGEQVLVGAASNWRSGENIINMMRQEWPEQVEITPKVLEACLVDVNGTVGSHALRIFLIERPHQIQLTESIVMFAAQARHSGIELWCVLVEEYRSQIEMTQNIFNTLIDTSVVTEYNHLQAAKMFRKLLTEWPYETRITNKTLLSFMRRDLSNVQMDHYNGIFQLFHELRREEFRIAIDSQVLFCLAKKCVYGGGYGGPAQAKAIDDNIKGIGTKENGLVHCLEGFRRGSAPPWFLA